MIARIDTGEGGPSGADDLLADIRGLFEAIDPMPVDLPGRIRLALALRELDAEIADFASAADELALAARGTEESRTITFDSDSLTIMIRVDANPDGTARIDGWIAPPHPRLVEIKMPNKALTAIADELGRFVFDSVPRGAARLIVKPPEADTAGEDDGPVKSVITPALTL